MTSDLKAKMALVDLTRFAITATDAPWPRELFDRIQAIE
jgi:hypothetical protein